MKKEKYFQKNMEGLSYRWAVVCILLCITGLIANAESADPNHDKPEQTIECKEDSAAPTLIQKKNKTNKLQNNVHARSEYMNNIQSQLKDAFKLTIAYFIPNPTTVVRLFIDTNGKLSRKQIELSSGDRVFDFSVLRAIDIASNRFPHPPDNKVFEEVFIFKSNGLVLNKQ